MVDGARARSYRERMRARVEPYTPADRQDVVRFRRTTFGPAATIAEDAYVRWMYERRVDRERPSLWLFRSHGEIEGFQGVIRTVLHVDGHPIDALWATELFVGRSHQLRGVGAVLLEKATEESDLSLAFEVTDAAKPGVLRTGWSDLGDVAQFVRPIDVDAFSRAQGRHLPKPASRAIELGLRAHEAALIAVNRRSGIRLTEIARFDERSDAAWSALASEYRVIARRDAEALNWRFIEYPYEQRYRCFYLERGDRVLGHAVMRIGERGSLTAGWIVDFLCAPRWARALLIECTRWLRNEGSNAVYCNQQARQLRSAFASSGFLKRTSGWPLMVRPPDDCHEPIRMAVLDAHNWFITSADSNVERPREGIVYAV